VNLLLDTAAWIWMILEPERLREEVQGLLTDVGNRVSLSVGSVWEIAIKWSLGKLALPSPPAAFLPPHIGSSGVALLPVEYPHAVEVATLPDLHRDPFDRLLVAQARVERMTIVTSDPALARYDVEVITA
jgi:PIN domain nuclease of toxin-antitoxin system